MALDESDGVQIPARESDELVVAVGEVRFGWKSSRQLDSSGYPGRGMPYGAHDMCPGECAKPGVCVCIWAPATENSQMVNKRK